MSGARVLHHVEYLALTLVLFGAALAVRDELGWAYWGFLLAPDVFGLLPATLLGRAPARGYLPPRGVWLYNAWHTFTVPILVGVIALLLLPIGSPWPVLGWLTHISIDRLLGFGLRGDDGGQAVF